MGGLMQGLDCFENVSYYSIRAMFKDFLYYITHHDTCTFMHTLERRP